MSAARMCAHLLCRVYCGTLGCCGVWWFQGGGRLRILGFCVLYIEVYMGIDGPRGVAVGARGWWCWCVVEVRSKVPDGVVRVVSIVVTTQPGPHPKPNHRVGTV